jgi:hypothetical protein
MAYHDRPIEELRPVYEAFLKSYQDQFGHEPNLVYMRDKLSEMKEAKENQMLNSTFGTMTPKNIEDCIKMMSEQLPKTKQIKKVLKQD